MRIFDDIARSRSFIVNRLAAPRQVSQSTAVDIILIVPCSAEARGFEPLPRPCTCLASSCFKMLRTLAATGTVGKNVNRVANNRQSKASSQSREALETAPYGSFGWFEAVAKFTSVSSVVQISSRLPCPCE
jgi:hypothetical protein